MEIHADRHSIKLKIWTHIRRKYPIWFFDATGSVMKDVDEKKVFLYSIVMYDEENENIIPISEFVTNDHTQSNIETHLFMTKNILKNHIKGCNNFI